MRQTVNYTMQRGEVWERLIMLKDRRTRRVRKPTQVSACVLINDVSYYLPSIVTSEGGVLLSLSPEQTKWFVDGTYTWDAVATVSRSQMFTAYPEAEQVVLNGTITVSSYANITPLEVDALSAVPLEAVV